MKNDYNNIMFTISSIRTKYNKLLLNYLKNTGLNGIATSHGSILKILFTKKQLSMKEIAFHIGKNKATVTSLVKKLEILGLLKRERLEEDNRITMIILTEKGEKLRNEFNEISDIMMDKIYKGFTQVEKNEFVSFLIRIEENLKEEIYSE